MTAARRCPARGVPVVTHATISAHHWALAAAYDRDRSRMVLDAAAARKGNTFEVRQ